MSNLVKEFFPDTPEKCQSCPGLEAAAIRIRQELDLATSAGISAIEFSTSDDPQDLIGPNAFYPAIATALTAGVEENLHKTSIASKILTDNCEVGTVVVEIPATKRNGLLGLFESMGVLKQRSQTHRSCASMALTRYFIPTIKD